MSLESGRPEKREGEDYVRDRRNYRITFHPSLSYAFYAYGWPYEDSKAGATGLNDGAFEEADLPRAKPEEMEKTSGAFGDVELMRDLLARLHTLVEIEEDGKAESEIGEEERQNLLDSLTVYAWEIEDWLDEPFQPDMKYALESFLLGAAFMRLQVKQASSLAKAGNNVKRAARAGAETRRRTPEEKRALADEFNKAFLKTKRKNPRLSDWDICGKIAPLFPKEGDSIAHYGQRTVYNYLRKCGFLKQD